MSLNEEIKKKTEAAEKTVLKYMPENSGYAKTVIDAMEYSVRAGGKRLRPVILLECYKICGGQDELAEPFAAALEMIHTYSLIHDDLPAMDNDTLRRGQKTTWVQYGEAMAVLAGDALLNYAYETASKAFFICKNDDDRLRAAKAFSYLASKAGIYGMVGGQCADVECEKNGIAVDKVMLNYIHTHKTGALLQAAFVIGAILAGAGDDVVLKLEKAAENVGMAFQIQDDILDVTGDEKTLGKNIGSDAVSGKETYIDLYGLDESVIHVEKYTKAALDIIDDIAGADSFLFRLVKSLVNRKS